MTANHPSSGHGAEPAVGADAAEDRADDTTVRRPRVPAPPGAAPLARTEQTGDTLVVRRGPRRRAVAGRTLPDAPVLDDESGPAAGGVAAYASRVAAPVRGSRKSAGGPAVVASRQVRVAADDPVPDAAAIRRALRARARRRLIGLVVTIIGLVVVLAVVLAILLFAVGV